MGRLDTFNNLARLSFGKAPFGGKKLCLMADVFLERVCHKTEIQDYFQYEFYNLKSCERRNYMTFSKLRYTMSVCNDPANRDIFDDKAIFNKTFADYIHRDWIDVTTASYAEFEQFVEKHPVFFVKARSGMFGKNAGRYDAHGKDTKVLYDQLKGDGCLAEELLSQPEELREYNAESVNTLRVVSLLCADGEPKVMAAVLRVGRKGKTADNFHHHGIAATIDVNTGITNSPGIDREFQRYLIHPDSGKQIIGFNIPSWEKVTELVRNAAKVVPAVRYVGWDVAVDAAGDVQLIEGNYGADPDVTQMPCRIGKWPLFQAELEKISNIK